ncbi:MAG: enoyl-CoA hydratase/isomerase family protein [Candidatus Lambdaproteobacteria bacterium]|nr:enoyl-CoA hydratase/isomerase family protein [Candidatus Lambdaproteobacteria bacterium]
MKNDAIEYKRRGAAGWAVLNRPDAMNAISPELVEDLVEVMDAAQADEAVKALVITGKGRAFSAGADLKFIKQAFGEPGFPTFNKFIRHLLLVFKRLEAFPKPVIAAVNGLALAGGLELLLCCDVVIAAESARIGDAHANFGLLPGGGGSARLPRKVGPTWAKYLLFTGEFFPARDLVGPGLVNRVVPDGELEAATEKLVASIGKKSPLGLRYMKDLVNFGLEQSLETALYQEILAFQGYSQSKDIKEGLSAFNEKRTPSFVGK